MTTTAAEANTGHSKGSKFPGKLACPSYMHALDSLALSTNTGTAGVRQQMLLSIITKQSVHLVLAIKHIKNTLEFFNFFKISDSDNCDNITQQISSGLEIEIKFKGLTYLMGKMFSFETSDEQTIENKF